MQTPDQPRVRHFSLILGEVGRFGRLGAVVVLALFLLGAGDNARVDSLGQQFICMCGCNQTLKGCNHLYCPYRGPMTEELKAAVGRGDSDSAIVQFFVQKYGTLVLAAPTAKGFDRVAWLMPYAALVGGISLVVFVVWAWRKRNPPAGPVLSRSATAEDLARFREQARKETAL